MRRLFSVVFLFAMDGALAEKASPPPDLQPLPEAPPPPAPVQQGDESLEPQVTIIKRTDMTVEEYRANGKLYMIKITPAVGAPYYLVDERGDGQFSRQDHHDNGVRAPRWIIHQF
ncbi:MAG: DUF2782 domain-containing protein [Pseudomonadota bacterium]